MPSGHPGNYTSLTDVTYVRPFVVPLSHSTEDDVRLVGTGTFIQGTIGTMIATCEHVAHSIPLDFRPYGQDDIYAYTGAWESVAEPIDAAWTAEALAAPCPPAKVVQPNQIAMQHALAQTEELLFFRGYSGENSRYGFDVHETNGSGLLTQQKRDAVFDPNLIELLWPGERATWSERTTEQARREMRFSDPAGFSGSLVWNTRFFETGGDLDRWSPNQALVTAILKRFVPKDNVLLASPIEAIRSAGGFI